MGVFSSLIGAAKDANEEAHGVRLERGLHDTMAGLSSMRDHVRPEALVRFLVKRQRIIPQVANWSREGCMKVAQTLQGEARKQYDFNLVESYALWMTGAWLEGALRSSTRARAVHEHLEGMAKDMMTDSHLANEVKRRA